MEQWKRIEIPEIYSHKYGQIIFYKDETNTQQGKDNLFNKWCWKNWIFMCKRMKLDPFLITYTKITQNGLKI